MALGSGIAIAGMWVCTGLMWHSKTTAAIACLGMTLLAVAFTIWLR